MSDDTVRKQKEPVYDIYAASKTRHNVMLDNEDGNNSICQRCSTVKWSQIGRPRADCSTGELITSYKLSQAQTATSACQLCETFSLICPGAEAKSAYEIRAYSTKRVFGKSKSGNHLAEVHRDATLIGVTRPRKRGYQSCLGSGGFLAILHDGEDTFDFGPRRLHPDKINFDAVAEWISSCEATHAKKCFPKKRVTVPGLHFWDCEDMRVVPATSDRYVTLSYVWGKDSSSEEMPLVVRDSITVTKKLGYRYLWVDRYCIKQDSAHKHEQIAQMHNIYAQSHLTLIAAAGQDPHFGLPGVTRQRRNQARVKLDGVELLHIPTDAISEIRATRWATRGWTYQEAFLARRRLIFTQTQVLYLCGGFYCLESVIQPPDSLNLRGAASFSALVPQFTPRALKLRRGTYSTESLGQHSTTRLASQQHLMEYSRRHLSYDSDALNACLGILQYVNSGKHPVRHLWGLPIEIVRGRSNQYLSIDLGWLHDKPGEMRDGLPSWTWVCWKEPVDLRQAGLDMMRMSSYAFSIQVPGDDGNIMDLMDVMEGDRPVLTRETLERQKTIRITSRVVDLSVSYIKWSHPDGHKTTVHFPNGDSYTFVNDGCADGVYCHLAISEDIYIQAYLFVDDTNLQGFYKHSSEEDDDEFQLRGLLLYEQREIESLYLREQTVLAVLKLESPTESSEAGLRAGLIRIRYPWMAFSQRYESEDGPFSKVLFTDKLGNLLTEFHMPEETELWIREATIHPTILF